MQNNESLNNSVKQILFEQYSSSRKAFSSQQDSLDKAYTTILFAEIAFYISRITPNDGYFFSDCAAVLFIALALFVVFISFIMSKSTIKIFQELMVKQIYAMDTKDNLLELLNAIESDEKLWNKYSYILSQLNWHIPLMILISTAFCFIKASFSEVFMLQKIYCTLYVIYIIMAIVVCLIRHKK
jgi:hypothetical protein